MQESIVFLVHVQCRRKESSRSLSHLLMSFLLLYVIDFSDGLLQHVYTHFKISHCQLSLNIIIKDCTEKVLTSGKKTFCK